MSNDRAGAYEFFLAGGPVVRDAHGAYVITETAAAGHVLRHPELFSSAKAFETLGSPFPLVPVAADPPHLALVFPPPELSPQEPSARERETE